jgi:hypothetical protein
MHPIVSALALVASAACLAGCDESPKSDAQYGEAVGIEIAAQGTAPALSIAVAMTKGHDVAAAVSSVAGAVFTATAACPAVLPTLAAGSVIRLTFTAQGGALHAPAKLPEDPGAACVTRALDAKPVTTDKPTAALDVIVEIRAGTPDAGRR